MGMRNLPDEQAHAFLFAEAPRILFPSRAASSPMPCAMPASRR